MFYVLPFGSTGIDLDKKRKKGNWVAIMSSIGGVGGASGAGAGAIGGAGSAPSPAGGAPDVGSESAAAVPSTGKGGTDAAEKVGTGGNVNMTQNVNITNVNMSTHDHICLRNGATSGAEGMSQSQQAPEMDLKKLIELMIMLKLLQALSEGQQGAGFSAMG